MHSLVEHSLREGCLVEVGLHPGNGVRSIGGRPQRYDRHDEQQEHSCGRKKARKALQHAEQALSILIGTFKTKMRSCCLGVIKERQSAGLHSTFTMDTHCASK